jgi:hypothetical protein
MNTQELQPQPDPSLPTTSLLLAAATTTAWHAYSCISWRGKCLIHVRGLCTRHFIVPANDVVIVHTASTVLVLCAACASISLQQARQHPVAPPPQQHILTAPLDAHRTQSSANRRVLCS